MKKRNHVVLLTGATALALAFAACGGDGGSEDGMAGNGSGGTSSGGTSSGGSGGGSGGTSTGGGSSGGSGGSSGGTTSGGSTGTGGEGGAGMAGSDMGGMAGMGGMGGAGEDCVPAATGNLVLNEIDSDGTPEDWIELLVTGANCVDLSGVVVVDKTDPDDADAYVFAADAQAASGAYVLLEGEQDFFFGLSKDGEDVSLFDADGGVIDTVATPATEDPQVYARLPDGGDWGITTTKTPGAANPNN